MQSSFFLIYFIKFKPTKSTYENLKIICREFLFMLISASFLLYSFEFSQDNLLVGFILVCFVPFWLPICSQIYLNKS
ncbi:unnamed protein product [Paramecium primaurelia]|uniref:Uncharacterized protein n=1 Tax=Paramecium primaurelia TaxID=5886 RepID=A0A8S1QVU2_PARPR|nr:unnamed protein product [Paramecium primaurelia]